MLKIPQRSISRDLSISVFLLVFFLQTPLVFYYFTREARQISTSFHIQSEKNAQHLSKILSTPLWQMDIPQVERIALAFTQNDPSSAIRIRDPYGHIFFNSIPEKLQQSPGSILSMEIHNQQKVIGYIDLYLSKEPYRQELARLRNQTLWILGISFLGIYLGVRLLARFFMRPLLQSIAKGLENIGNGRYEDAFPRIRHREIGAMADTFYNMASRIRSRENVLQMMNTELQTEVRERKKAEEEALRSEARRKALLDAIPDMIFQFDAEGVFLDFQGAKDYLYLDPNAFLHQKADLVLPENIVKLIHANIREALATDKAQVFEYSLPRKNNQTEYFEARMVAATEHTVLAIVRNISERILAEQERKKLEGQLARAQKMEAVGLLAGGVAHDLNNVLSGLVSYPDLLLRELPENSPMHRRVRIIQKSGQKAAQIVQDLLTLARRGVAAEEQVHLNTIIQEYLCSPEFEKLSSFHPLMRLETRLDASLPYLKGSGLHLGKMLMNLVSNAAEAMPDGGDLVIETRYDPSGDPSFPQGTLLLCVRDTGQGIHPEDREKIFEPFYTKKVMGRSGTGLGMAVVWSTVQDHRGRIEVDSAPGKGCLISVRLPASPDLLPAPQESKEISLGSGQHLLVVDDLPEQLEIATLMLQSLGYRVSAVTSGEEALSQLSFLNPDLVLLDMIMGKEKMDGLDCFLHMRTLMPELKVLLVTGFSEGERIKEALALGALGYVKKPYTRDSIAKGIHEALHFPEKRQL